MDDLFVKYNASCLIEEEGLKKWEQIVLEMDKTLKELEQTIKQRDKEIRRWRSNGVTVLGDDEWLLDYIINTDKAKIKLKEQKKKLGIEKRKLTWHKKKVDKVNANHLIELLEAGYK